MAFSNFWPAAILAVSVFTAPAIGAEPSADSAPDLLLGEAYPLEASVSQPAALLHWLDSLAHLRGAGLTAGKTVELHRQAYVETFDVPTAEDQRLLELYHGIRVAFASDPENRDRDALTRAFFEAQDLDDALKSAGALLDDANREALDEALRHFAVRFHRIWKGGEVPKSFLKKAANSGKQDELAQFLVGVARFYGISPDAPPRPRLILAPVPSDSATHAQAIDRFLLVEVRSGDGLLDQIAPIVHENAHLLFHRVGNSRLKELEAAALAHGVVGQAAWQHLKEALPTAIAQGVAQLTFQPEGWSLQMRWYDVEVVDVFAKKIFPNVKRALGNGRALDPAMIGEFVEIYGRSVASRTAGVGATPRAP